MDMDIGFLEHPTRHLFFTGKGGVGKTSLSTAAALSLADAGRKVLLVSTDAASNLDDMLGIELRNTPVPVPGALGLSVLNIDPDTAAESYRQRVLAQMDADSSEADRSTVREQLSGACTTEIASFDEFSSLLSDNAALYDHIVFDTAPTGHTLRLLSLPKAWTGFLRGNDRGASCLGPHSGLKMQEERFKAALEALSDPLKTTVILVTRPDKGAMAEAARTSEELHGLGLDNQRLAINGVFHASAPMRWHAPSRTWASKRWTTCPGRCVRCRKTSCPSDPSTRSACPPCVRCWRPAAVRSPRTRWPPRQTPRHCKAWTPWRTSWQRLETD
jgi:arsenite-transporting ATPase